MGQGKAQIAYKGMVDNKGDIQVLDCACVADDLHIGHTVRVIIGDVKTVKLTISRAAD